MTAALARAFSGQNRGRARAAARGLTRPPQLPHNHYRSVTEVVANITSAITIAEPADPAPLFNASALMPEVTVANATEATFPAAEEEADDLPACFDSWVPIVQGLYGSSLIPAVFNASLELGEGPYGTNLTDGEIANTTGSFENSTFFIPTDAAVMAFADANNLTVDDLLGDALPTAAAVVWTHGCSANETAEGSCPIQMDGDEVSTCGSSAKIVDGPYQHCGAATLYSIDSVLTTGPLCDATEATG